MLAVVDVVEALLVDVSDVALEMARERAASHAVEVTTIQRDLQADGVPGDGWDVLVCVNFLDRSVFGSFAGVLAEGGLVVASIATVTNLERNERPSRRFLLENGELKRLAGDIQLEVVSYEEGWFDDRHSARLVARR